MTQFDESKHNRATDGKFTNKPHAEAEGVSLGGTATPKWLRELTDLEPADQERVIEQLRANQIRAWAKGRPKLSTPWPKNLPLPPVHMELDETTDFTNVVTTLALDDNYLATIESPPNYTGNLEVEWGPDATEAPYEDEYAAYAHRDVSRILTWAHASGQEVASEFGTWNPKGVDGIAVQEYAFPTLDLPESDAQGWELPALTSDRQAQAFDVLRAGLIDGEGADCAVGFPQGWEPEDVSVGWSPDVTSVRGVVGGSEFRAAFRSRGVHTVSVVGADGRELPDYAARAVRQRIKRPLEVMGERAQRLGERYGVWDADSETGKAATRHILGQ